MWILPFPLVPLFLLELQSHSEAVGAFIYFWVYLGLPRLHQTGTSRAISLTRADHPFHQDCPLLHLYPLSTLWPRVQDIMTAIEDVYMLEVDTRLDDEVMTTIWQTGHSRVPVYDKVSGRIGRARMRNPFVGLGGCHKTGRPTT